MLGPYRRYRDRRIIVNTDDDRAWEGVPVAVHGPLLVLRGAVMLVEGQEPVRMDGEVVIDRGHIDWIQAY